MRMAFLAASPMIITRPICEKTPVSKPRSHSANSEPQIAMGVPRSTPKGSDQLSYWAARMRKTTSRDRAKMTAGGTPAAAAFSWYDIPA